MINFDKNKLQTPYFIVDEKLLIHNLEILADVKRQTGCEILLAQKGFSMYHLYPTIAKYLDGTCASGLHEALLAHEYFDGENHVFSPAFTEGDFPKIFEVCQHFVFNSFSQWQRFKHHFKGVAGKSCGMRINPQHSTQGGGIYDPCSEGSRFGVTLEHFEGQCLEGLEGLHFHTLCQQGAEDLVSTWQAFEAQFGEVLHHMKWVNLGGGHHITREGYNTPLLVSLIENIKEKYNIQVYLEPGEAIALNAGFLVSSVVDIVNNGIDIAVMDASAACHMPDVLEMPYRPHIIDSGMPDEKPHTYRLGGPSCLAGDVIGDYSFNAPLKIGDRLIFTDMAIYSMVKTNTFNGIKLPDIAVCRENGDVEVVKTFGYDDFKSRL